jgi:hypothetical protein
MDLEGDARTSTVSPRVNSFLMDLSGLLDAGVLLLALIGVVNFGNVLEDRVRGSGDDSELPSVHPLSIGVAAIAIASFRVNDGFQWRISSSRWSEFERGQNAGWLGRNPRGSPISKIFNIRGSTKEQNLTVTREVTIAFCSWPQFFRFVCKPWLTNRSFYRG